MIHILGPRLADRLSQRLAYPRDEISLTETGPVLSCQGGPGVTAVLAATVA